MKASPIQTAFNAGEFGPELAGQVNFEKYAKACSRLENFVPLVQGPARRRGGTRYVQEVKDSTDRTWLARFEFSTDQAYILEFGDLYIRFYTDNGPVLETGLNITGITQPAGVITSNAHGLNNGDWVYLSGIGGMTELNGRTVVVSDSAPNTFRMKDTNGNYITTGSFTAYTSGGTAARVYTVVSPWPASALTTTDGTFALRMVQSGDVLYICHPDYAPRKLTRAGAASWSIATFTPTGGPFEDVDPDMTTTVYASAASGTGVTITSSAPIFSLSDVGRLLYLEQKKANAILPWETAKAITAGDIRRSDGKNYVALNSATTGTMKPTHTEGAEYDGTTGVQWEYLEPGYGWVEITGFTSGTVATATVVSRLPDQVVLVGNATTRWAWGDWGWSNGWPTHVTFFRDRLTFARSSDRKIWFSVAGDYENFRDRDDAGLVTADMAVTIAVQSDQANAIQYLMPAKALIIGTAAGEHTCGEMTDSEPFGPANVTIVKSSEYGSKAVQPMRVGESILFVQRSGRKLREVSYDALKDGYQTKDMTVLAPHMVPKGKAIVHMAYQKEPYSIVWVVLSDGALRGFTFNVEQDVLAWHRHTIGGSGIVESVECVPSPDGGRDDLWMIVRRTINGVTKRYVEYMQPEWESGDDQEDAFYVDCGLTYDSTATTTITGLDHLEGQTVAVLADGATHPNRTVASGSITLQRSASVVQVGLAAPAKLATMKINAGAAGGTAQGKTKRIHEITIRLLDTLGGEVGPTESETDEILFRSSADPMGSAPAIFTGDKDISWRGGYEKDGIVWYVNNDPLPATVVAIMPSVVTND